MILTRTLWKPKASAVLTAYLKQCNEPNWTSYFVKFRDVDNDQFGMSHFNWTLDTGTNYHILRTGCYPYLKYHCSKREVENLQFEDKFFRVLKVINLGLPLFFYGLAAIYLISHTEIVNLPDQAKVPIYFLYKEDKVLVIEKANVGNCLKCLLKDSLFSSEFRQPKVIICIKNEISITSCACFPGDEDTGEDIKGYQL